MKCGLAGQHVGDRVELVIPSNMDTAGRCFGPDSRGINARIWVDIVGAIDPADTSALSDATETGEKAPAGMAVKAACQKASHLLRPRREERDASVILLAEEQPRCEGD